MGKTTLISMLTGMTSASSGTALVNGRDITKDLEGVQMDLSLCPQANMLYNEFTVAEHITFFGQVVDANLFVQDNLVVLDYERISVNASQALTEANKMGPCLEPWNETVESCFVYVLILSFDQPIYSTLFDSPIYSTLSNFP